MRKEKVCARRMQRKFIFYAEPQPNFMKCEALSNFVSKRGQRQVYLTMPSHEQNHEGKARVMLQGECRTIQRLNDSSVQRLLRAL